MTTRPPMNPRHVEWSGENPGMYLRETADGPYVSLISFARVVISPHGRGHAAIVVLDPDGDGSDPARPNFCATDNEPLAQYLLDHFVHHFLAFRGKRCLDTLKVVPGWDFAASGDGRTTHTESCKSTLGQVALTWNDWGDQYMVELTGDKPAVTGTHEMFSMFIDARSVDATVNGRPIAGRPFPRSFAGKADSSTAFLAFSETWVKM